MQLSTRIKKGRHKDLVFLPKGLGQLKGWPWGVFHLKGHKDVPLITLQFHCQRVRYRSYVGSVTEFTRDPTGCQPGLATGAANSVTSARILWAKDCVVRHSAIIDYAQKHVMLKPWGEGKVTYVGS